MINPYKRLDVFKCKSEGHTKFGHHVSAYHVLRVKNCYPQGCLYFKWHCRLLNKGQKCKRGFQHVGRKCFGCKHYYDEKINNQPILLLNENDYAEFLEEIEDFEDWLTEINDKNIDIEGTIVSVKPAMQKTIENNSSRLNLRGYFIHFNEAFIGMEHWEDHCYAFIYPELQTRLKFASGDKIEFRARVDLDRGRLVLKKLNSINFLDKSVEDTWSNTDALVARHTTIGFEKQQLKCLKCKYGMLIDVIDKSAPKWERRRELMCLKAVKNPNNCIYHIEDRLIEMNDRCPDG